MRKIYFEIDLLAKVNPELVPLGDLYLAGPEGADIESSNLQEWSRSSTNLGLNSHLRYEVMANVDNDLDFGKWVSGVRCYHETSFGVVKINTRVDSVRVTDSKIGYEVME
jgi:hypothetical protein